MMKKQILAMTAAVLALSMTACGSSPAVSGSSSRSEKESTSQRESRNGRGAGESLAEADPVSEETEQQLYNDYIEINNDMVGRIYDSLERYLKYVEFQEEFAPLEEDYWCYSISSKTMDYVEEAYELASAKGEKSSLDEAYLELYPSIRQMITSLNEIYEYTDIKKYLDDDYEKGKEYHSQLWAAMTEYDVAGDTFMNELEVVAEERNNASLQMMKDEGYETWYAINMVLNYAGKIEDALYEQEVWDDNILDMDMEVIQPLYDAFVENVEAVLKYSQDSKQLEKEGIPEKSAYWSTFLSAMKDSKVSLTEVLQHVKNGEPLSESDTFITEIAGNCSLSSFDVGVSSMINDYNYMISY